MNVGDRIFVSASCTKYGGRCCGHNGTVERIYLCEGSSLRFLVRLDDLVNDNLIHGGFWFDLDDIVHHRDDIVIRQSLYFKKGNEKNMDINDYVAALCGHPRTNSQDNKNNSLYLPKIKKVIFNPPATIIFWQDDTKTVVKAVNEPYDPEKGLAMAISKKAFGNNQSYYSIFEKNLKKI